MSRITVIGGTGYAGSHLVQEAARRGHEVTSVSRSVPTEQVAGVRYLTGSILEPETLEPALANADAVISAVSPRGEMQGRTATALSGLADRVAAMEDAPRLGVIGGAGSLRTEENGPLLADTPDFPAAFVAEAREMGQALEDLRARDAGGQSSLDWFFVSPAAGFGAFAPGEARGVYRVGGDVLLADESGASEISGADLALAVLDEVDKPAHRRERFTVAY